MERKQRLRRCKKGTAWKGEGGVREKSGRLRGGGGGECEKREKQFRKEGG